MSVNIFDMAQTWNNGATTFAGIKLNVTDTASASGSLLMDLQAGGSSRFSVSKAGAVTTPGSITAATFRTASASVIHYTSGGITAAILAVSGWKLISTGSFSWSSAVFDTTADLFLARDAANTLGQRNGTAAQTFNIYNTYTDASNYERVAIGWAANIFSISPGAAGTGSTRVIHISGLPTSNPGPGILWNNSGTPAIGT